MRKISLVCTHCVLSKGQVEQWHALTTCIWEPTVRQHATHCGSILGNPCVLWLVSGSLHRFWVVSKVSLDVGVAALLASTAPFKMAWSPPQSRAQPGNACAGSRGSYTGEPDLPASETPERSDCPSLTHTCPHTPLALLYLLTFSPSLLSCWPPC